MVCALGALSPKVSRFGLVQTMLRTLFAPVDFLCLYHAASIFFKEEFVLTAEWPVAIICTVTSLLARVVINFSMLASLSSGSLWSYVTDADGTTKLTLALTDTLLGSSASTPSSAAYAYIYVMLNFVSSLTFYVVNSLTTFPTSSAPVSRKAMHAFEALEAGLGTGSGALALPDRQKLQALPDLSETAAMKQSIDPFGMYQTLGDAFRRMTLQVRTEKPIEEHTRLQSWSEAIQESVRGQPKHLTRRKGWLHLQQ